jgi:hypothetical protein
MHDTHPLAHDIYINRRQINMKTIAEEMTDHILLIEDEAVARFYDLIGSGIGAMGGV